MTGRDRTPGGRRSEAPGRLPTGTAASIAVIVAFLIAASALAFVASAGAHLAPTVPRGVRAGAHATGGAGRSTRPLNPGTTSVYGANVLADIPVKDQPTYASWDSFRDYLYVTNFGNPVFGGNTVTIVAASNNAPLATYPVGDDPINSVFDNQTKFDYVLNYGLSCNTTVFNGTQLVTSVAIGCGPLAGTYDPANGWVYISDFVSNEITIVNGTKVVANLSLPGIPSPARPAFSVYDPVNQYVYVPDTGTNNVTVVNGTQFVANISVGVAPQSVVYDPATSQVYVLNAGSNNVTILSGTRVVGNAFAGGGPSFGTYDAANGYIYVTDQASDSIFILNGQSEVANLSVGHYPRDAAYDPVHQLVYVPNWDGNVSVLNGTSIVASVAAGANPYSTLYDPATRSDYTCVFNSNNLSVLGVANASYPVSFAESGLPAGENWTVGVAEVNFTAAAPSPLQFPEPNGSYAYTVPKVPGYIASVNATGTFTVAGGPAEVNVSYAKLFVANFTEQGLPAGTSWSVTIGPATNVSTGFSLELFETNGTYSYSVAPVAGFSVNRTGQLTIAGSGVGIAVQFVTFTYAVNFTESGLAPGTDWQVNITGALAESNSSSSARVGFLLPNGSYSYVIPPVPGYVVTNRSGSLLVAGTNRSITISFAREYPVTFSESGLPHGDHWTVTVTPAGAGGPVNTSRTSFVWNLTNGSYGYSITDTVGYLPTPPSGTFGVHGGAAWVNVSFSLPPANASYEVSFVAEGLPSGQAWTVDLGGLANTSIGATIGFRVPNGSFAYSTYATGYTARPPSGTLVVDGPSNVPGPVAINFTSTTPPPARYRIAFTETNLPPGTLWGVAVEGAQNLSRNASVLFSLVNGTYTFSVVHVDGFVPTPSTGGLTIAGTTKSVAIDFAPFTFAVSFEDSGLPAGTTWGISVEGVGYTSSGGVVDLVEPNGTYGYSVLPVSGYSASTGGTFTVSGGQVTVPAIVFTKNAPGASGGGGTSNLELAALGTVAVAAAAVAAVMILRRRPAEGGPTPAEDGTEPAADAWAPEETGGESTDELP